MLESAQLTQEEKAVWLTAAYVRLFRDLDFGQGLFEGQDFFCPRTLIHPVFCNYTDVPLERLQDAALAWRINFATGLPLTDQEQQDFLALTNAVRAFKNETRHTAYSHRNFLDNGLKFKNKKEIVAKISNSSHFKKALDFRIDNSNNEIYASCSQTASGFRIYSSYTVFFKFSGEIEIECGLPAFMGTSIKEVSTNMLFGDNICYKLQIQYPMEGVILAESSGDNLANVDKSLKLLEIIASYLGWVSESPT